MKNRFFDNRLQLNIEAFRWKYSGQQISHFGLDSLGLNTYFTENAGASTIKGVDVDVQFRATPTTLLKGAVQYLDSRLDAFAYDTPRGGTFLPPAVGCPYAPVVNTLGQSVYHVNCAGKPGFNSPKWAFNAGFEQTVDLNDLVVTFAGEGRYRGNRVVGFDHLPQQNSGSDFTIDGSISLASDDDAWRITMWGRNLTNRTIPTVVQYNASTANAITAVYSAPRTYGVRGTVKF